MALRFFDGFDTRSANVGYGKWINQVGIAPTYATGRLSSGYCVVFGYRGTVGPCYFQYITTSPTNEYVIGFAVTTTQPTTVLDTPMLQFLTGSQVELGMHLYWPHIYIYRGDNTLLGQINNICLPIRWMYLEIAVRLDYSNGYVVVKVDNSVKLNLTSLRTSVSTSPSVNTINFGAITTSSSGGGSWNADDFYMLDKTGTEFNDFLGDVMVYTLMPNQDGSVNDWLPNSGTIRYDRVNEVPHNSDTTYIYTSTDNAKQLFRFPSQSDITILAVQNTAVARKDDSTTRYIKMIARLGGNEVATASQVLSNSYLHFTQLLTKTPANQNWSLTDFNNCEFGVMHTLTP